MLSQPLLGSAKLSSRSPLPFLHEGMQQEHFSSGYGDIEDPVLIPSCSDAKFPEIRSLHSADVRHPETCAEFG